MGCGFGCAVAASQATGDSWLVASVAGSLPVHVGLAVASVVWSQTLLKAISWERMARLVPLPVAVAVGVVWLLVSSDTGVRPSTSLAHLVCWPVMASSSVLGAIAMVSMARAGGWRLPLGMSLAIWRDWFGPVALAIAVAVVPAALGRVFPWVRDDALLRLDSALTGGLPRGGLGDAPWPRAIAIAAAGLAFGLPLGVAGAKYLAARMLEHRRVLVALALVTMGAWCLSLVWPAVGPMERFPGLPAEGSHVRQEAQDPGAWTAVHHGSPDGGVRPGPHDQPSPRDAFPALAAGWAVVALLMGRRTHILAPLTALAFVGSLAGRDHYLASVLTGITLGLAAVALVGPLGSGWSRQRWTHLVGVLAAVAATSALPFMAGLGTRGWVLWLYWGLVDVILVVLWLSAAPRPPRGAGDA